MREVIIYTDGGARGNPGPSGCGAVIIDGDNVLAEVQAYLGVQTNNVAEYEALIRGLSRALELDLAPHAIEVRMDSELIVKQMQGLYRVKEPTLKIKHALVKELTTHFASVRFTHVRREYNKHADALANAAMDAGK
jgi:ribonuclease HI